MPQQFRRPSFLSSAAAILFFLTVAGCSRQEAAPGPARSPDVWAVVDGREIRQADVDRAYRLAVQPTTPPPSEEETLAVKLGLLDELISQDILLARAATAGIQVADSEVDTAYADRRQGRTDEAFALELGGRGITPQDVKDALRRELTIQKLLERDVTSKTSVTDEEITAFYEQNRGQFNVTETQYRIAQIVITPARDPQVRNRMNDDAATPAEAQQKLQMLLDRIQSGADFGTLAMDYSEEPQSAAQGGDLGYVPASALNQAPPQLRSLVLQMEPGSVRAASIGGIHTIVALVAKEAAGQRDLNTPSVRDGIRDMLQERKGRLLRAAYLATAVTDADIENRLARSVVEGQGRVSGAAPSAN